MGRKVSNRKEYLRKWWLKTRKNKPWHSHYRAAKCRCTNPNDSHYHRYGGRGIKFELTNEECKYLWFRDKAYKLNKPSIDRINFDGNYSISNCRFIEFSENKRKPDKTYRCIKCGVKISRTSGKYGLGRCNSCAKTTDRRKK